MRWFLSAAILLGAGLMLAVNYGCQTNEPGSGYALNTYTGMVDARPDKVTTAAAKALDDLKLNAINSSGTKVDGLVTGRTAQDKAVTINISQAGDNVSKVSIQVGDTGDEALSAQIFDKIKDHLKWF